MLSETDSYLEFGSENMPTTYYYCGKCFVELQEVQRRPKACERCSKSGSMQVFKCPSCGLTKKKFSQDQHGPRCYSCKH